MTITSGDAIELQRLSKVYSLAWRAAVARLAQYLAAPSAGRRGRPSSAIRQKVSALRDVSISIPRGQVVGLVGGNGAGKSTLLRIIAGQARPSSGTVRTAGRVTAILDIATGMLPDQTGRENVYYMASLYGMTRKEVEAKLEAIIDFSGIGRFVDYPVRSYSAGMKSRLAFSLVSSTEPDILLIDEALSVGDVGFAVKCRARMQSLCKGKATVLLVSHNLDTVREMCQRVIWLHHGEVRMDGAPTEVIEAYRAVQLELVETELRGHFRRRVGAPVPHSPLAIEDVEAVNGQGRPRALFRVGESCAFKVKVKNDGGPLSVTARLEWLRVDGVIVCESIARGLGLPAGRSILTADMGCLRFGRFPYQIRVRLESHEGHVLGEGQRILAMESHEHAYNAGYYQPVDWKQETSSSVADVPAPKES
ncbi:MAG: Teichoic acid export ATP-binding protein TagH [Nitrospira sp.]|nr:MAG: Teichoic acid export ATP-binding protein TagH [Nitrospira sp.]